MWLVCKRGLASWDTGGILGTRYPEDTTGILRTLVSQDAGGILRILSVSWGYAVS